MLAKTIFSLVFAVLTCQIVVGLDLIEMNDANKNAMNLYLSKALTGVQEAYQNSFKFKEVGDIKNFLIQCEQVRQILTQSKDSDFNGLAANIKRIMADESIAKPCSVTHNQLMGLNTGLKISKYDYLSQNVFNTLVKLNKQIEENEGLKMVASHALRSTTKKLADALLESATDTINVYLGEVHESGGFFDFDIVPKQLCETSLIEPICKLVRRTKMDVSMLPQDLDDFAEIISSKDESKIDDYTRASGVSMEMLRSSCAAITRKRAFKPIQLIRSYVSAGFMDEEQVQDFMKKHPILDSYSSLYELCILAK